MPVSAASEICILYCDCRSMTPQASPSPERIFETLNAYQKTEALRTAIELDIFTAVGDGATAEEVRAKCGASERGVRILCDYLTINGFLTKQENLYRLAPDAAIFLRRGSPAYMGDAARFLNSPRMMDVFRDLTAIVKTGHTTLDGEGTVSPDNPIWVEFARNMAPMFRPSSQDIAAALFDGTPREAKVLDIAAGHGLFGIAIAKLNPLARIVAVDWKAVLDVATENAKEAGVAERHEALAGSAFDVDFGTGYDLVLLTNFLHHFDVPTIDGLLRKIRTALKPGGRVATLEFVPNDDRVTPPAAAAFAMIMLGSTRAGDAYTFTEYESMFRNAGFARSEVRAMPRMPESLIVSE
jgi:2-polyprenyl-3-methyl-5-hydroxy-6-metoxy-1,4-benzoquinol methylase